MKPVNIVRYVLAALIGALAASIGLANPISATLHYPDSWAQVACGQSREELLRKIPNPVLTEAWDIKGDFWEARCLLGSWQMQVSYDRQQKVVSKHLALYIGTKETFKVFHFL